jgi:glutamyl-tRNA synthetase
MRAIAEKHPEAEWTRLAKAFNVDAVKLLEATRRAETLHDLARLIEIDHQVLDAFHAGENDDIEVATRVARYYAIPLPEINVSDFREAGYLPEAITNFLALLGWNPGTKTPDGKDVEKFDNAFLAEHFSLDRIGKGNARFDRAKLLSFNGDAIAALSDDDFAARWRAWCDLFEPGVPGRLGERRFALLAKTVRSRSKTFRDAVRTAAFALVADDEVPFDAAAVKKLLVGGEPSGLSLLPDLRDRLAGVEPFEPEAINAAVESFAQDRGLGIGKVAQPLRVALTGSGVSPPLGETLAVLGRESVVRRIERCVGVHAGQS